MTETPTPKQALVLWCLLGRHGSALQSEIVPRVEKADREALIAARFLASERRGRSLLLSVTDKGWNWAGAHLRAPLPPGLRVLQDWLARIDRHLAATGATLADLIGAPDEADAPPETEAGGAKDGGKAAGAKPAASAKRPPSKRQSAGSPPIKTAPAKRLPSKRRTGAKNAAAGPQRAKPPTAGQLRARIEEAYLALTNGRTAQAVRLSALRAHLSDLDRATLDAGLAAILRGDRTARLSQFTNPKSLDAAEREAAYSPAGNPFHILWIQS